MNHWMRPALFSLVLLTALPAVADRAVWVETHSWSGSGMKTSPRFLIISENWRVLVRRRALNPRQVFIHGEPGQPPARIFVAERNVFAHAPIKGQGMFYFSVPDADAEWEIKIHQKLTVIQEWNLKQVLKQPPAVLQKIAAWTGEAGRQRFTFEVAEGKSWRLVGGGQAGEEGKVKMRVVQLDTADANEYLHTGTGDFELEQWFYRSGSFELNVEAVNGNWRAEVQTE